MDEPNQPPAQPPAPTQLPPWVKLGLQSDYSSPCHFRVIDLSTGRPVFGVSNVEIERGCGMEPQIVKLTVVGMPIQLAWPSWEDLMAQQQLLAQQAAASRATPFHPMKPQ